MNAAARLMLNLFISQELQKKDTWKHMTTEEAIVDGTLEYDVTFLIGKNLKELHAVGFLLARISPVLEKYLNNPDEQHESGDRIFISVPSQFEYSSIQSIVYFSFGFKPKVTAKNLFNMRAAALHYCINPLYENLDNMLSRTMSNEEHFCWVLHSGCTLMDYDVVTKCLELFETELDHRKVIISNYFLCLDFEPDLCFLLRTPDLRIERDELLERLEEWANCKEDPEESLKLVKLFLERNLSHQTPRTTPQKNLSQREGRTEFDLESLPDGYAKKPDEECNCRDWLDFFRLKKPCG